MSYNKLYSVLELSRNIIECYIKEGMIVVDCTMGNGNDTLLLSKKVGDRGSVTSFDIQKLALDNTLLKLQQKQLSNRVNLILDGHENIDKYIDGKVDFIIYNLGYLPKGDKSITTNFKTTIKSVEKSLNIINENGIILLIVYPGHENGLLEKEKLDEYFNTIDQKKYNILKSEFINQVNNPPILYSIEKSNNNN